MRLILIDEMKVNEPIFFPRNLIPAFQFSSLLRILPALFLPLFLILFLRGKRLIASIGVTHPLIEAISGFMDQSCQDAQDY